MKLEGELHVWLAFDRELRDAAVVQSSEMLLSDHERTRRLRMRGEVLQHQFLITRALQRTVLSVYAPQVAPRDWTFTEGEHGKPALGRGQESSGLHFNLAHTDGMVAMAVALESTVGVDVENVRARTAPIRVAERFFTEVEAAELAALPEAEQIARFYALWTLKESWLKAVGQGLSAGLSNVSFGFGPGHDAIQVRVANDDSRRWKFWQARPTADHVMGLALRLERMRPPRVRMWRWIPEALLDAPEFPEPKALGSGEEQRPEA